MSGLEGFNLNVQKRSKVIDPNQIFESVTTKLRGPIENIWGPQSAALSDWHAKRDEPDVQIDMPTGGGKTLVGLFIGQSLVNETRGKVIYACPTNQLVEQAARRASECSVPVATYFDQTWTNKEVFDDARGMCITNYHALFTAWSKFAGMNISGVVFDDAHVAGNHIRSQYTLQLPASHDAFVPLCRLYAGYFARANLSHRLDEAMGGHWRVLLFVPMFEVLRSAQQMAAILRDANVAQDSRTKYAWENLRDHLDCCMVLISGSGIEITPPALPLHRVSYFGSTVRRIYLTASLPSPAEFIRAFGVSNPYYVRPGGKSGAAQRLFLFLPGETDDDQRGLALSLIDRHKACIITPSKRAAEPWLQTAKLYDGTGGHAEIERFAKSTQAKKIVFAARYDGVDLPGDACRVLVLDRIPSGGSLYDRFVEESLQIEPVRWMRTATRVVQAIGRIFRSNTDHGAVLLCGATLQEWLRDPRHWPYLPPLLQQQVQLGVELRKAVDKKRLTLDDLLDGILKGTEAWDKLYENHIDSFDFDKTPVPPKWLAESAAREQAAFARLWEGDAAAAAAAYAQLADSCEPHDARQAAWYRHWEGRALDRLDKKDVPHAIRAYTQAANVRAELGRPKTDSAIGIVSAAAPIPGPQAERIAQLFSKKRAKLLKQLQDIAKRLVYGDDTKPAEAAVRELGDLLGLESTRPDHTDHTGPDVVWRFPGTVAKNAMQGAALELKTDKKPGGKYRKKDDIGQFQDHVNYIRTTYPDEAFYWRIIGRRLPVAPECNPPEGLRIVELEQIQDLVLRTEGLYRAITEADSREEASITAQRWLDQFGLNWPLVIESLESDLAEDLQGLEPDQAAK